GQRGKGSLSIPVDSRAGFNRPARTKPRQKPKPNHHGRRNMTHLRSGQEQARQTTTASADMGRRAFLGTAAGLATAAVTAAHTYGQQPPATASTGRPARTYGPNAAPVRYPDPD